MLHVRSCHRGANLPGSESCATDLRFTEVYFEVYVLESVGGTSNCRPSRCLKLKLLLLHVSRYAFLFHFIIIILPFQPHHSAFSSGELGTPRHAGGPGNVVFGAALLLVSFSALHQTLMNRRRPQRTAAGESPTNQSRKKRAEALDDQHFSRL